MNLAGKASRGYAMAALLVALSVMAVLLSVALPDLVAHDSAGKRRGAHLPRQSVRAGAEPVSAQSPGAAPTSLDELIKERMLRKKFKDPLSPNKDGEFQLLYLNLDRHPVTRWHCGAATGEHASGTKPTGGIRGVASKNTGTVHPHPERKNPLQRVGICRDGNVDAGRRRRPRQGRRAGTSRGGGPGRGDGRGGTGGRGERITSEESSGTQMRGRGPAR